MADNTTLPGTGETVRTIDRSGVETQVVQLDHGGAAGESLTSPTNPLPVAIKGDTRVVNAVTISGPATIWSGATDGMATLAVQLVGAFSGTVIVECSNDNSTWVQISGFKELGYLPTGIDQSITGPGFFRFWLHSAYARIRCSAYSSGSPAMTAYTFNRTAQTPYLNANVISMPNSTVSPSAYPTSGAVGTTKFIKSAASTNADVAKVSPSNLFGGVLSNNSAAAVFFKFYNKGSAPTVGTDTPVITIEIPAHSKFVFDHTWSFPRFSTGIAFAITGAIADNDTTAIGANDVSGWLLMSY